MIIIDEQFIELVKKAENMSVSWRLLEFGALIEHTEEDMLDRGEILWLAALCLTMTRPKVYEID